MADEEAERTSTSLPYENLPSESLPSENLPSENLPSEKESLPYEQARDELANVVKRLEAGGLSLEDSLELWERGERLATICSEWLEGARARLATAMAAGATERSGHADGQAPF
ncbi:MAG TPA: exodeoxyribonuclease VII small subunit [Streptosporangiaceae bacterium]|nr:exodeoxyribonuclease VII small subunit [Streptosporangiaceae bacterium]